MSLGYRLDDWRVGLISSRGNIFFYKTSIPAVGLPQPLIQWVPEVKQPGHECDYSSPFTAKVKNVWSYTFTSPYALRAWCLTWHKNVTWWNKTLAPWRDEWMGIRKRNLMVPAIMVLTSSVGTKTWEILAASGSQALDSFLMPLGSPNLTVNIV